MDEVVKAPENTALSRTTLLAAGDDVVVLVKDEFGDATATTVEQLIGDLNNELPEIQFNDRQQHLFDVVNLTLRRFQAEYVNRTV